MVANPALGATSYCWSVASVGETLQQCSDQTTLNVPAGEAGVNPGPVTVTAEAVDALGAPIVTDTVSITVMARDIIDLPAAGQVFALDQAIQVQFDSVPTATQLCATIRQGGEDIITACDPGGQVTFTPAGLPEGPISLSTQALRGAEVIGSQLLILDRSDA